MVNSERRKHLTDIGGGYYLSKADPQYWHKLLRFKPDDGESLFHVGIDYEEEAKRNLLLYQRTKQSPFLNAYRNYMEKALAYTQRATRNGYVKARADSLRIEETLNLLDNSRTSSDSLERKTSSFSILILSIIVSLILGVVLFYLFQEKDVIFNKPTVVNNNFASFIPVQVKYEKPSSQPQLTYREDRIYIDPSRSIPLPDALVNKVKEMYKIDPSTPIRIRALDSKNGSEKGTAVWNGPNSGAEVYIYPEAEANPLLFESTTVLRSALYQFVQKNGYFPAKLDELTKPFPDNYLSSLPKDPQMSSSQETSIKDGTGGWVYQPPAKLGDSSSNLKSMIEKALEPNLVDLKSIAFEPLAIEIDRSSKRLTLKVGDKTLRSYPVAVGKDGLTPEGEFIVNKKIANPNKNISESVFGTRALELSNPSYAIHGTNDPTSIGKEASHGCIRLNNHDIEELYSLVPQATRVKIESKGPNDKRVEVDRNPIVNPYISNISNPNEEDPYQVYYWNK